MTAMTVTPPSALVNPPFAELSARVARSWAGLGWNVIPYAGRQKRPFSQFTRDWRSRPEPLAGPPEGQRIAREIASTLTNSRIEGRNGRAWRSLADIQPHFFWRLGETGEVDGGAYIYPASGPADRPTLVVFDLDFRGEPDARNRWSDEELRAWFLSKLPPTTLALARNGKLKHLYYRVEVDDPKLLHKIRLIGAGSVDMIATTGVATAGTLHKDGYVNEYVQWDGQSIQPTPWPERGGVPPSDEEIPLLTTEFIENLLEEIVDLHEQGYRYVDWVERHLAQERARAKTPAQPTCAGTIAQPTSKKARRRQRWTRSLLTVNTFVEEGFIRLPEGDFEVRLADGRILPLSQVPLQTKFHVPAVLRGGKDDRSPSGWLYRTGDGPTYLYDWSTNRKWRVLQPGEDPLTAAEEEGERLYAAASFRGTRNPRYLAPEYILDDLPGVLGDEDPLPPTVEILEIEKNRHLTHYMSKIDDGKHDVIIVIARHGLGKTRLAAEMCKQAETVVSVTAHRTLVGSNAKVLGLDEVKTKPKARGSVTFASLDRYAGEPLPDLYHLDEASRTFEFAFSSTFKRKSQNKSIEANNRLFGGSGKVIITDADMTPAQIQNFMDYIRLVRPRARVKIVIAKKQEDRKKKVIITSLRDAKARIHTAIMEGKRVVVATGSRSLPHKIVNAYTSPRDDRFADVPPADSPVSSTPGSTLTGFCVTGRNSRLESMHDYIDGDYNKVVREHNVFCYSPAIQSGVSIEEKVDACFVMLDNLQLDAETVLQMTMRCRNVEAETYIIAVPDRKPDLSLESQARLTREYYLEEIENKYRMKTAERRIVGDTQEEDDDVVDPPEWLEVAKQIYIDQRIRHHLTWMAPVQRIAEVAEAQGYEVEILHDQSHVDEQAAKEFDRRVNAAGERLNAAHHEAVSQAEDITHKEREELEHSHSLEPTDRVKIEKFDIKTFYDIKHVTPDVVKLDNKGRFRGQCKLFGGLYLLAQDGGEVGDGTKALAWSSLNDGMRPIFSKQLFMASTLMYSLLTEVLGWKIDANTLQHTYDTKEVMPRFEEWWSEWNAVVRTIWPNYRTKLAKTQHGKTRLLHALLRKLGIQVHRTEGVRHGTQHTADATQVYEWSSAFRGRVKRRYEESNPERVRQNVRRLVNSLERAKRKAQRKAGRLTSQTPPGTVNP